MELRSQVMSKPYLRHPDARVFAPLAGRTHIGPMAGDASERIAAAIVETRAGYQKKAIMTGAGDREFDGCPDCDAPTGGREAGARLGRAPPRMRRRHAGFANHRRPHDVDGLAPSGAPSRSVCSARRGGPSGAAYVIEVAHE